MGKDSNELDKLRTVQNPRIKRRPLLQHEVEIAIRNTKSNAQAAQFLGVAAGTYKRYAEQYFDDEGNNLYKKHMNKGGRGIRSKKQNPDSRFPLEELLAGKHPTYPDSRFKEKLVRAGYVSECCNNCGFTEERVTDGRIPLLLNYHDENRDNRALENIYLLCYNCHFILVGALNFKGWHRNVFYSPRLTKKQCFKPQK
jgi:5-methylcytosine-specific restriction endonuclease McrA